MDEDTANSLNEKGIDTANAEISALHLGESESRAEALEEVRTSPDAVSAKWMDSQTSSTWFRADREESAANMPVHRDNQSSVMPESEGEPVVALFDQSKSLSVPNFSQDTDELVAIDVVEQDDDDLFADVDAILNTETNESQQDDKPVYNPDNIVNALQEPAHNETTEQAELPVVELATQNATSNETELYTVEYASVNTSDKLTSLTEPASQDTVPQDTPTAEVNYTEPPNTQENTLSMPEWGIQALASVSADEGADSFQDVFQDSTLESMKWINPAAPDASLQIEVEEEEVAVHIPFTPKKEATTSHNFSAFSESPVNSNTTTPFAKVLPLTVTPPRQPISAQNSAQSNRSFGSPEGVHLPDIHSTRSSFAHSSKAISSRPVSQDKSRSQSMKSVFPSPSGSFSQQEVPSPLAPALFNLDAALSPSAKFRSFIKSLQPVKSTSADEGGEMAGVDVSAVEGSVKLPVGSTKDVQARIAKVQAEQERFRQTEKLKRSMLGVSKRISFQNTSSSDLGLKKPTLKVNKNGAAQNFNANSIRAGLTRQEFRDTLEVGGAIVHRSPDKKSGEKEETLHHEAKESIMSALKIFQRDNNHIEDHHVEPHPVTRSGEGYMSEADWKITVKDKYGPPKKSTKQRSTPMSHKDGLALQRANAASSLNLDQFIESTLKEQASQHTDSADCPGEPDVPLCYLQSAHLIDRRFGWNSKDHSVVKHDAPKLKSWMTLRAVVQSTGAFHLIAAAAAPVMTENPTLQRNKLMQPAKNAPYIVQEATPVSELVASLIKSHPRAASPESTTTHATAGTTERPFTSPGERVRAPHFSIAKQIPQRLSPDRKVSPPAPKLKALSKEEAKSIKIKANTKEFHDRYNGLIFRDSSRDLTWHDTEDMILGTVRPRKNELLLHRSDMRWAGKTLNMFRPWSAAREVDVMDKFRLKRADTVLSKNLSISKPCTPGGTAPGSPSSVKRGKDSPNNSVNPTDRMLSRYNSKSNMHVTHPTNTKSSSSHSHASKATTTRSPLKHRGSVGGSVASKGGSVTGGGSVGSSGIPSTVTFAVSHSLHPDQSDNNSAYTLSSNMHGSRASHSKRPPLLINVVKPLPLPPILS